MDIILFLGSGISFPSGLPNGYEITHSMLYDKWHSHSDQLYYSGLHPSPQA